MRYSNKAVVALVSLLALAGCGSDVQQDTEQLGDAGATLILKEGFADGGVLRVVEQDDGFIGFAVTTPVGSDAAKLSLRATQEPTLKGVYERLLGREAPAVVTELSETIVRQRGIPREPAPTSRPVFEPPTEIQKSAAWFMANLCVDVNLAGGWSQLRDSCVYGNTVNSVQTSAVMNSDPWGYDRSYALNEGPLNATQSLSASTWTLALAPGYWQWMEWGGSYSGARAKLKLPNTWTGNLGITGHAHTFTG